jgi:CRISPR-associated endonuclease/helicase Cas3
LLAGFCSVADWVGSNSAEGAFGFQAAIENLQDYYQRRLPVARNQLEKSGLIAAAQLYQGVASLLPHEKGVRPRQLQLLVDQLPKMQGLTLIEAPTGTGKTETALAYAWRLLAEGMADSIIFALPTQATANAMLKRMEDAADVLFQHHPNLVLAHGKSAFNDDFWKIQSRGQALPRQGAEEAGVQCAQWLSSSRKRAFLGQIGVCTIDQVLISVLPVCHKFVRGFGIGKSVLIVDEVHAYDSYMYGLLGEVLRRQRLMGGSALLLSATLPHHQRSALAETWGGDLPEGVDNAYPLVTHIEYNAEVTPFTLPDEELPEERAVTVEVLPKPGLLADDDLIEQMLQAAGRGAQVVIICNLVDVAQDMARRLRQQTRVQVDLFHARYRFCDRQAIEKTVLDIYGKNGERKVGRILVATQVVEQSLDLDFDWMITQLCPVDLLFQRLGRLHRHERTRPAGFEHPCCTVLIPDDEDYGYHGLIYGNTRVLWRTAQLLLRSGGNIVFPGAYRTWIEVVYQQTAWGDEPQNILDSFDQYCIESEASQYTAKQLMKSEVEEFSDTDSNVSSLTRDGEMSLNVLPVMETDNGCTLLEGGTPLESLEKWWKDEAINLNMVSVPHSWGRKGFLPRPENGLVQLPLTADDTGWRGEFGGVIVRYSKEYGLEKEDSDGKH